MAFSQKHTIESLAKENVALADANGHDGTHFQRTGFTSTGVGAIRLI